MPFTSPFFTRTPAGNSMERVEYEEEFPSGTRITVVMHMGPESREISDPVLYALICEKASCQLADRGTRYRAELKSRC